MSKGAVRIERIPPRIRSDRAISVVYCGSVLSCDYADRISIIFSPDELRQLTHIFVKRALNATTLTQQDFERDMVEAYSKAYEDWEKTRKSM